MNVLASPFGIRNFENAGTTASELLKRYFLLFDTVYIDQFGLGDDDDFFWMWLLRVTLPSGQDHETHSSLKEKFKKSTVKLWDAVESVEVFEKARHDYIMENLAIFEGLSDFGFREIERIHGNDPTRLQLKKYKDIVGDIWYDVAGNELVSALGLGVRPSYSHYVGKALKHKMQGDAISINDVFTSDFVVPDFDKLSWDEIFDLRNDSFIKSFRAAFLPFLNGEGSSDDDFNRKLQSDLWDFIAEMRPSIKGAYISGVLSNIPFLPINPAGIFLAGKNIKKEHKIIKKYGHLFFIQNLRDKIARDKWNKSINC